MALAGGEARRLVRETMIAAGGYWRPLAAVARLLEELGELSEILYSGAAAPDALAAELADLWIITTALADQFLADVEEPGHGPQADVDLGALVAAAGPIARVVNHYDGPKVPRPGEPMPTLQGSVAGFHMALSAFASARRVDLGEAVRAKIEHIHERGDIERFGRQGFDPSTAPVLGRAEGVAGLPARLWGAPDATGTLLREPLRMFAKAARAERLEGFLIPGTADPPWLAALVTELDPAGSPARFELAGVGLRASVVRMPPGVVALVVPA